MSAQHATEVPLNGAYKPAGELIEHHNQENSASKRMTVGPDILEASTTTPGHDGPTNGEQRLKRKSSSRHLSPGSDLTRQRLAALEEQLQALSGQTDRNESNGPVSTKQEEFLELMDFDGADDDEHDEDEAQSDEEQQRPLPDGDQLERRTVIGASDQDPPLPERMMFPIQVGTELFRFSGASISSDAPSYFSSFFKDQIDRGVPPAEVRTLYIDRDPTIFRDISLHLQGYHVDPRDSVHYTRLFADAHWFNLPRLKAQLEASPIFVRVGNEEVQISRDLFKGPGNSPNYFTLGFAVFFTHPTDVFPGLRASSLLRPPPIAPPKIEGRSGSVLREIIDGLKGYTIHIRDEDHRNQLLRDVRYYHFKGLEQQLIRHNIYCHSRHHAISIRLSDIRPEGASTRPMTEKEIDVDGNRQSDASLVVFKRPFVDENPRDLIIATGEEDVCMWIDSDVVFTGVSATRLHRLFASLGRLHPSQILKVGNEEHVWFKILWDSDSSVVLDGEDWDDAPKSTKSSRIHRGLWKVRLDFKEFENQQIMKPTLYAVKLLATSSQRASNARKEFL